MSCTRHMSSRGTRTVVTTFVGLAVVASCRDTPTAAERGNDSPSFDVQFTALGIPASRLPRSEVATAVADSASAVYLTDIAFPLGAPEQVAVVSSPDGGFPTNGSSYLVVSSGDARDPRLDGAWTWYWGTCDVARGDIARVELSVSLPANAVSLEFDYRFFTADDIHICLNPRASDRVWFNVLRAGQSVSWEVGSAGWQFPQCGSISYPFRCHPGFAWFPGGMRHLSLDVRQYAGFDVTLSAGAMDDGRDNLRQTGVAIDGLRLVLGNFPPIANAGGPYVADEGIPLELDGSASFDPDSGALTYAWDITHDGLDDGATAKVVHTFSDDGWYMVALRVTDPEGRRATATTTVTVRNVAPSVLVAAPTVVNPEQGQANVPLDIQFTDPGADTHSAIIDCDNGAPPVMLTRLVSPFAHNCTYTTAAFGPRTIRISVTDDDGGVTVRTHAVSILYSWSGFFAPVRNPPSVNEAKAGSAVPLKFYVGGYQGLEVLKAGFPASQFTPCGGYPAGRPVPASTSGSSRLSYDHETGQYHYVWKTENAWAGTCRELTLTLADGSLHHAAFRFR